MKDECPCIAPFAGFWIAVLTFFGLFVVGIRKSSNCQVEVSDKQEVKGLKKLYAYALDPTEICLHAIGAMVSEIRVSKEEDSVKIMFTCISYLV